MSLNVQTHLKRLLKLRFLATGGDHFLGAMKKGREQERVGIMGREFSAALAGMGVAKETDMQGHSELQLPLHCFHFVLSAYYLAENPFLLFHLSSHFDQCKAS